MLEQGNCSFFYNMVRIFFNSSTILLSTIFSTPIAKMGFLLNVSETEVNFKRILAQLFIILSNI